MSANWRAQLPIHLVFGGMKAALVAALVMAGGLPAQAGDSAAARLVDGLMMGATASPGERLGVAGITTLPGEQTAETSRLTGELILALLDRFSFVRIVPPDKVANILDQRGASAATLETQESVAGAELEPELDSLLVAVISDVEGRSRITARIFDTRSGGVIGSAAVDLLESAAAPAAPEPAAPKRPAYESSFLRVEVRSVGLSESSRTLTVALAIQNVLVNEEIYLATTCCYGDWLQVVDDRGQIWKAERGMVTDLPVTHASQFAAIPAGGEISVTALFSPWVVENRYHKQVTNPVRPRSLSLSGSLSRRTKTQQEAARGKSTGPRGQGFSFGITVPVPAPE